MAFALNTNGELGIASSIIDTTTDRQRRILKARPTLYLTPDSKYIAANAENKLMRWHDATGQGFYRPGGTSAPTVVSEANGLKSLLFSLSKQEFLIDDLPAGVKRMPAIGTPTTIIALIKVPASGYGGGIIGGGDTSLNPLVWYVNPTNGTSAYSPKFQAVGDISLSVGTINDDKWHLFEIGLRRSGNGGMVRDNNGAIVSNTLSSYEFNNLPLNFQPTIGAYGALNNAAGFGGKIAAIAIIPRYYNNASDQLASDIAAEFMAYKTLLG